MTYKKKNLIKAGKIRMSKMTLKERKQFSALGRDARNKKYGWSKYSQKEKERALKLVVLNGGVSK